MSLPYSAISMDEAEAASVAQLQEQISAFRWQTRDIRAQHEYVKSGQAHHKEELAKTVENTKKTLDDLDERIGTTANNYIQIHVFCCHLW
ncbi:unnamed protein product [Nippostrongylus brasiliensis]|uniref:t-SNARE coiled-coil homology domain-containing protein n=1 Tax=Nippostrongylus brasiliensis TaxID=27835 RepID=A0A0N4XIF4_NIPBR|nr:unnamed protein product [Nippostrongylus brasiliensis]